MKKWFDNAAKYVWLSTVEGNFMLNRTSWETELIHRVSCLADEYFICERVWYNKKET